MGRGVSYGGGQSSLGYLFGNGEGPKPAASNAPTNASTEPAAPAAVEAAKPAANAPPVEAAKNVPAGVNSNINNYHRADGQNTGNFITDRPSTKVQAAPGGGSSLGYLFGGASK